MDSYLYKTIIEQKDGLFKDKGSKFIARVIPFSDENDLKTLLQEYKSEHVRSRHIPFAYRLGFDGQNYRSNDDGEPSGSAGKPILGQIDSFGLTNVLILVARYFGGTKLGIPGLINAFRSAAADAIENAEIIEREITNHYLIRASYNELADLMNFFKREPLEIIWQKLETDCRFRIAVKKEMMDSGYEILPGLEGVEIEFIETK